tara:strand:- start:7989 stop:8831 length:843 start_codon:yes stop_codon:yes gene_type:complete
MKKIKKLIMYFIIRLKFIFAVNWTKTFYINFRTQSFRTALKLPILVFGRLKIYTLKGNIEIIDPIHFGMMQIGKDMDHMPISLLPVKLRIHGDLIIGGDVIINSGSVLEVLRGSSMILGKYCIICSGVYLKSENLVEIGKNTRITSGCFLMDTNMHSLRNTLTGEVTKRNEPISIGNNCWIAMNTTILKGTKLPNGSIVGRGSFLNKDYTKLCPENSILAGSPVKVISKNVQRVWSLDEEIEIRSYFDNNQNEKYYKMDKGIKEYSDNELVNDFKLFSKS